MADASDSQSPLTLRQVASTWWPLAASWMLMSLELPAVSAVIARLADPEIHLAAYGGVVFPLALIIESPIIMLLAASTALSRDWPSYIKIRRFMMRVGFGLTALHLLIALTPLYYVVVRGIIGVPEVIIEPARVGLVIMTPWTWSIAYRRFHQGVLIRANRSRAVGLGTFIRLSTNWVVLALGYLARSYPGIVVGTTAIAVGVISEAIFVGFAVRPALKILRRVKPVEPALSFKVFLAFYIPLVLTSLLNMLVQPIGSAALSRMPLALESLAIWPVVSSISFIFRSPGIAFNEVVVAQLERPGAVRHLRLFTTILGLSTTGLLLVLVTTPLAEVWLVNFAALSPELAAIAWPSLWLLLPLPALVAMQSWYQGNILNSRHTRSITEAIVLFLSTSALVLWGGVAWGKITGLYIGLSGFALATGLQTLWLWIRSRRAIQMTERGDAMEAVPSPVSR